jgi:hypothetical protein
MKKCFKCETEKPLSDFYVHKAMADGHLGKCKDCTKRDVRAYRRANRDHYRAYEKARFSSDVRKQTIRRYYRKWRDDNREKYVASYTVHNAIRDGKIKREPCAVCGDVKVHAHHFDYSRPLDVVWLCALHHMQVHHAKEPDAALLAFCEEKAISLFGGRSK